MVGVIAANAVFSLPWIEIATKDRSGLALGVSEFIGTFVLVLLILALVRSGSGRAVPVAVGAWVAVIIFATPSTGFANPAVTVARMFTDTYTGISPESVPLFVIAQLLAAVAAAVIVGWLVIADAAEAD